MVVLVPKDATQVQLFRRDQSDFDGIFCCQASCRGHTLSSQWKTFGDLSG
jgi:hypothetical protein